MRSCTFETLRSTLGVTYRETVRGDVVAKRGRPKKDGLKPGWMLFRSFLVLNAYDQARARGDKHSAAIIEAVSAVRSRIPGMPISETEVRRVLADFQSRDSERSWIITEGIIEGPELDLWFDDLKWIAEESPLSWVYLSSPTTDLSPAN